MKKLTKEEARKINGGAKSIWDCVYQFGKVWYKVAIPSVTRSSTRSTSLALMMLAQSKKTGRGRVVPPAAGRFPAG